ncbi:MAG TPA: TIGR04222 domain-containing membrane protein [Tepidisphaeraceae bacterium]|jgi:uncharacterized protein (TIGR04222 family)
MTPTQPLDFYGPQFLRFYGGLYVAALAASLVVRAVVRRSGAVATNDPHLDPYETAFLAGGGARVALVGISRLIDRGAVRASNGSIIVEQAVIGHSPGVPAVERAVLASPGSTSFRQLRQGLVASCETIRQTLESQGLLVAAAAVFFWRLVTWAGFGLILGLGVTKFAIGLSRDKPVSFLIVAGIVTVLTLAALLKTAPFRTLAGDRLLMGLKNARPNRRSRAASATMAGPSTVAEMAGLSVALYGMEALSHHPQYRQLQTMTGPTGNSSGSACSSGCGGGGSSCGGGGCGGCGGGGD